MNEIDMDYLEIIELSNLLKKARIPYELHESYDGFKLIYPVPPYFTPAFPEHNRLTVIGHMFTDRYQFNHHNPVLNRKDTYKSAYQIYNLIITDNGTIEPSSDAFARPNWWRW